jgi:hypothetical protein
MPEPAVTRITDVVYGRLPDYARDADAALADYPLKRYLASLLEPNGDSVRLLDATDPDTSVTGTCELANPSAADSRWLPWLGWLVGIDTANLSEPDRRDAVAHASTLQRRGSATAIKKAVSRTLTGTKSVRVFHNVSGTEPYLITVVVRVSEVEDAGATLAAALTEKPAGADLDLQQIVGTAIYADLDENFTDYAELDAAFTDYDNLSDWEPPTP